MTRLSVKRITRVCLLIATLFLAVGCTSISQMPSSSAPIEDRSFNKVATQETPPVETPFVELKPEDIKVPDNDLILETLPKVVLDDGTADRLSFRFKLPLAYAQELVSLATQNAYEDFPKKEDLLAIAAVESSYNAKARYKGSYGLMQIEKKSHLPEINGRSLYNPSVNFELGASILREYYVLLDRNKKAAILAYNWGIGNYIKRRYKIKLDYYLKYLQQLRLINSE